MSGDVARHEAACQARESSDLRWAETAGPGEYLHTWEDEDGRAYWGDPGSRGGRSDEELASIDDELGKRDLRLVADDVGLRVFAVGGGL